MNLAGTAEKKASLRALVWLADERNGDASVKELAEELFNSTRGGPALSVLHCLCRSGWAEAYGYEGDKQMRGRVKLTIAGLLFRDYLSYERRYGNLSRVEMHGRIRALEMALQPLARAYDRLATEPFLHMQLDACGISPAQTLLARKILDEDHEGVTYPWTPGRIRLSGR